MTQCLRFAGLVIVVFSSVVPRPAAAHFQVLLPSDDVVQQGRSVDLEMLFTHPMEQGPAMEMGVPRRFGVIVDGKSRDLSAALKPRQVEGKTATAYTATVRLDRPSDHVFYLEPAPYWEPGEEKMIVHYTKVVVDFGGAEKGWDAMVGFPVEIEPLVRPYGLWAGNVFRGVVKRDGKPVPFATIEIEYFNERKRVAIPNDAFITQVIKADANGVFCYAMPKAGWWGFAALVEGTEKMKSPGGKMVEVELGGVIWVKTVEMK